ncbi:TRAP dicarboxylate transporter, DctQ subunit, unknown substrate 6 [hydrothermal vent metagenome]|uniref:Tripartite ATP-independent periplasmic transporters DctQ component domain-containing protein n=1 Tax=hydrothermal vent metagenome TaxID=652676 RepID=A0A3B0W6V3_9ZZZZ
MPLSHPITLLLKHFIRYQNHLQNQIGHTVAWASLLLVGITALVVILRYGFDTGSIALQESIMYTHAFLFMLGMAYTYQQDKHVRVDVFYAHYSIKKRAWVNLLGTLFLTLPTMSFILWSGWDYVAISWEISETSAESNGIAYLYLLKTLILIMAVLVIAQALSIAAQAGLTLLSNQESLTEENDHLEGKL